MKRNEARQFLAERNKGKAMAYVETFSPPGAREYAEKFFSLRLRGRGDKTDALEDVAEMSSMSPRSFERLLRGETKNPGERLRDRIRIAYLSYCEKLIERLQHEVEIEKKVHGDAALGDIGDEVAALVEKIQAAKSRAR